MTDIANFAARLATADYSQDAQRLVGRLAEAYEYRWHRKEPCGDSSSMTLVLSGTLGITIEAFDGGCGYRASRTVSWQDIIRSVSNPLIAAMDMVDEAVNKHRIV